MSVQKNLCYIYWPPVGGPTACPHNRGAYNRGAHIWKRLGCVSHIWRKLGCVTHVRRKLGCVTHIWERLGCVTLIWRKLGCLTHTGENWVV